MRASMMTAVALGAFTIASLPGAVLAQDTPGAEVAATGIHRDAAYAGVRQIAFEGAGYRDDIARRAIVE